MQILIAHGGDRGLGIPATEPREWADALRFGLESAGARDPAGIDIRLACYGDLWRPDGSTSAGGAVGLDPGPDVLAATLERPPTDLQAEVAAEILPVRRDETRPEWDRLAAIVHAMAAAFGAGEPDLTCFLEDLDEYLTRADVRDRALGALRDACRETAGPSVLIAHGIGSVVAYDLLATDGARALGVEALVTVGSPLGMASVRRHIGRLHSSMPFPGGLAAWTNVSSPEDFAAVVPGLAGFFAADDGRRIADSAATGRDRPTGGHGGGDPIGYLASGAVARAVMGLLARGEPVVPAETPKPPAGDGTAADHDGDTGHAWQSGDDRGDTEGTHHSTRGLGSLAAQAPEPVDVPGSQQPGPVEPREPGNRTVERAASADFPPVVAPGSTHDLIFAIAREAVHARSTGLSLEAPVDQHTLVLKVGVYAADFEVRAVDDQARTWVDVTLDLDNPEPPAEGRFKLTAHLVDERRETPIYVTFYRGNLPVGQLTLLTVIDPVHEQRTASIGVSLRGAPDPDYVLVVTDRGAVKGSGPFDISVSVEGQFLNKPLGAFPVSVDAWEYASRRLDGFRRVKDEPQAEDRIRAAEVLGVELWNDLPEAFQRFYWEELHPHPGASIAIYSQEPYIPWELIKPQRGPGDEDGFLGAVFSVARWKQATRFPDPLTVSGFSIIAPVYTEESGSRPLPGAQAEADGLVAAFGAVRVPGDRATVRRLLESNDGVQLIHFAGHGDFDPQDTAAMTIIRLSDAPLVPGDLTRAVLGRSMRPFVFLNACEVGEQGWALTRIGGWAEAFTDVGFSGFVGPYWAVNDRVARKAAMLFYHSLSTGETVGEAVRQVRLRFYTDDEHRGHPSWLAYTLHCQPNIRIGLREVGDGSVAAPRGQQEVV
jgi:hypothetical protein